MNRNLPVTLGKFIFHFIAKQRLVFIVLMFLQLAWSVDNTIMPYIFKKFLDVLIGFRGDKNEIWFQISPLLILGGGLWLAIDLAFRGRDYLTSTAFPKFEANIRMSMIDYVQNHSINYFSGSFAGSITNKINDMAKNVSNMIDITISFFIPTLVSLIIGMSIFISLHLAFGLMILTWVTLHLGISLFFAKKSDNLSNEHSASNSNLTGMIVDSLSNIVTTKLFVRKDFELKYLGQFQDNEKEKYHRLLYLNFKIKLLQGLLCFAIMGAANIYLMVSKWQSGVISTSEVVYIFYTSWGLMIMAWVTSMQIPIFLRNLGTCKQALELIQIEHEVKDERRAVPIKINRGKIEFKNVHFNYHSGNDGVFANKNIVIKPKQKVGLVGISGSGKTTFVNLINRFYDLDQGQILIDGQDISVVTHNSLHSQIANITQDPALFHRSIFDNIAYGKENTSKDEVIAAAKKANCHDFISALPLGYDSIVGQRGAKLSGGQRQRISIARAILKDAPILILDEATSALDSITEKYIQESLDLLMKDRTCIVIAHRLSTLNSMDRILVFDSGKIVEDGTHEELIAKNDYYSRMWNLQQNQ